MVIGVLQVELFMGEAGSLKDKRRIVMSLKDRIGQDNGVAIAEVDKLEAHQLAVLGIVTVSNSAARSQEVLQRILQQLRNNPQVVVSGHRMEMLTGQ
jgi:uncharacterized protein